MLTPRCHIGMALLVLNPPPLPLQTASDTHAPPGPLVVKVVPPTTVIFVSSDGENTAPEYAPLSPED